MKPFNHSGPYQSQDFLLPALVRQLVGIKATKRSPILCLGSLKTVRDVSDVCGLLRAYHLALRRGRPGGVYSLGSGPGVLVQEFFELVCRGVGVEVKLSVEPSKVRATDIGYLVADVGEARRELEWEAKIPLEQSIKEMIDVTQRELDVRSKSD